MGALPHRIFKTTQPWKEATLYQASLVSCSCVRPVGRYAVAQFPLSSKGFPPAESQILAGEFEVHFELRTDDETSPRVVLHSMGGESAQLRWQLSGMALSLPVKPFADNDASLINQTNFQVSLVDLFSFWFCFLGR